MLYNPGHERHQGVGLPSSLSELNEQGAVYLAAIYRPSRLREGEAELLAYLDAQTQRIAFAEGFRDGAYLLVRLP